MSLAVPARPDEQYTLSDIWNPLVKKLKSFGKELDSDIGGILGLLERLRDLPALRNALAAHENEFAKEYPRQVVVDTAQDVIKLVSTLRCGACATFATPPVGVSGMLSCRCGTHVFLKKGVEPLTNA